LEAKRGMKAYLIEHPKLKWEGISTWPPRVGGAHGPGDKFPMPGEGNLENVEIREEDYIGRLSVTVDFMGRKYSGQLPADDPQVVTNLYQFLKKHLGEPVSEIGKQMVDL
jgi:hypothetical protein